MKTQTSKLRKARSLKPIEVRRGSITVKIYTNPTRAGGKLYDRHSVVWREFSGQRKVLNIADPEAAKQEAEKIATRLSNGQVDAMELSNGDVHELLEARRTLQPFGLSLSHGTTLLARALTGLPSGTKLEEAVADFARRHPANAPRKTVVEVVVEFIADRRANGCSSVHLRDLEIRLGRFGRAFSTLIRDVTAMQIADYVTALTHGKNGQPAAPRSRENSLRAIASLFNFARRRKYIATETALEVSDIEPPRKAHGSIGTYTPSEVALILAAAGSDIVPSLAIAAFAGLRVAEVARLDWSDVRLLQRNIVVNAANSKTATRRLVPISDNLAAWLTSHSRPFGPVNPCAGDLQGNTLGARWGRAAKRAGVKWVRNGLRHSFITYKTATQKDVPAVALDAGNSPAIIFSNYRALATEAEGKEWFSIMPTQHEDVIQLSQLHASIK